MASDPAALEQRLRPDEPDAWERDDFDHDERDDEAIDGPEPGEECGRWRNGRLSRECLKAGSEECEFECPYRG